MNTTPYVVSGDIYLLLRKWAARKNFSVPDPIFFRDLRKRFSDYMCTLFPNFEFISESEIENHMRETIWRSKLPCISLDPIYYPCKTSIEITRTVNTEKVDHGIHRRHNTPPVLQQLRNIKSHGLTQICLVDDVIFSGTLIDRVIQLLSHSGIEVPVICAGVGIQEGLSRIESSERKIYCARTYTEIIDEVCERDFYLGIPFSGRSLLGKENIGLPYILPYGNPEKWASIPKDARKDFSVFCINQTILLFEEIERVSRKAIDCSDIERKVPGQPNSGSYVAFLKQIKI